MIMLKFLLKNKDPMLWMFPFVLVHNDISSIAKDDISINIQLTKKISVDAQKLIPESFIGIANIPAPIDVPDIRKILPNILFNIFMARDGIEPPTQGFSVLCSTN